MRAPLLASLALVLACGPRAPDADALRSGQAPARPAEQAGSGGAEAGPGASGPGSTDARTGLASVDAEPTSAAPPRADETSADADSEAESSGETGAAPGGRARLCSRPYALSSTPGKGRSSPGAEPEPAAYAAQRRQLEAGLEVQVDAHPGQAWTSKQGVEFDGLDADVPHTIEIRDAKGRRVKAMVLDFDKRGSEDLCLGMNAFYGTWQLRALRTGARCGPCTTRAPR